MAVKIKLKRMGKIRAPFYRIIVADARTKRDGRAIEEIGKYHPKVDPSLIEVDSDRAQYWLSVGAQPTDPVRRILEITGDWQKFKGLPGTEGTLKTAAPRPDKREAFAAAAAETVKEIKVKGKAAEPRAAGGKAAEARASEGKAAEARADKGSDKSQDRSRARKPGGSGEKASGAQDEPEKPASSGGKQASAGKAAEDTAAKDTAAKAGAAKDAAAKSGAPAVKDAAAKGAGSKDSAAKDSAAKDSAAKDSAGKDTAGKRGAAAAKGEAPAAADGDAGAAAEPAAAVAAAGAGADAAGQDGEA